MNVEKDKDDDMNMSCELLCKEGREVREGIERG